MLTSAQFDRTRRLALSVAGIELVARHRQLLAQRSRRLGIRDNDGLDALLAAADEGVFSDTQQLLCLPGIPLVGAPSRPERRDCHRHLRNVNLPE